MRLNIAKLVEECGGAAAVARITGAVRTAPYGWIARNYVSSRVLESLKKNNPKLDLNRYFDEQSDSSTGTSE